MAAVKAATALRAEINPLWAAEQKLANELERIARIEKLGVLSTQELAAAQAIARKRFDETTDAIRRQSGAGGGLSKNQKQTLLYTASDIIGSSANGINPTQLLIQQGPQVLQAFAAEEGGLLKLRALINPVTVGLAALTSTIIIGATAWLDHANAMAKATAIAQGSGRVMARSGRARSHSPMLRTRVGAKDLDKVFAEAEADVAGFMTAAMSDTVTDVKEAFRAQVRTAGLGERLANAVRGVSYSRRGSASCSAPR